MLERPHSITPRGADLQCKPEGGSGLAYQTLPVRHLY